MATPIRTDIAVTLHLSEDVRAKLEARAALAGQDLSHYISSLVEAMVETPRTLEEISGPVYQRFLESGTTDQELSEELERAKHEMRADRGRRHDPERS